ncbi:MAG: substrate-binding domain-containing protein [Oscillospiraceae bacterium]|nr:substrate-binding domain-containing protein [Oscillospiraceae bacterium]
MKKIIAIVLAAVMCLSLAACSSTDYTSQLDDIQASLDDIQDLLDSLTADEAEAEEAEVEEAEAETEEVAEETSDKITVDFEWNGQMEVWSILPTTGAEGLVLINDAMGAMMEAEGFTYVKKDAQGDPSAQAQFVEDAIAAGNVGCLMIAAMSVDMLQDVVLDALDAGIAVAMLGAEPTAYGISGCVYTAYEITGMYAVQAAEDWVANRVAEGGNVPTNADGLYEVACDVYTDIQDGVYRSNAMTATVDNSDILVRVSTTSSYGDSAYSDAYDNAQDVLGANPDCHIFIAYEPEEAMGAADAIADYCDQNGLDLADYCVIPCYGEDSTFLELYADAQEDPSSTAIKGYSTYGDPAETDADGNVTKDSATLTGEHLGDILLSACGFDGYDFEYGATYYDTITVSNIYGYSDTWVNGNDNPAIEYKITEYIG